MDYLGDELARPSFLPMNCRIQAVDYELDCCRRLGAPPIQLR
jgi:hypothetical protein